MTTDPSPFELRNNDRFAFLLINNAYIRFATLPIQLANGLWVLNKYPANADLHWEKIVGQIRFREISQANLVLVSIATTPSYPLSPQDLDAGKELAELFSVLQLGGVLEYQAANLAIGSVDDGQCHIRQLSAIEKFLPSKGYTRSQLTLERLEEADRLASTVRSLKFSETNFDRFGRGLYYLSEGFRQTTGQERMHRFTRALEALIYPERGNTQSLFAHRCQLFALKSVETSAALNQCYEMRSDAEHIHRWDKSLQNVAPEKADDVASWRTRQMEVLATFAYTHILKTPSLHGFFQTDDKLSAFWKSIDDAERMRLWGERLDLSSIKIVRDYDQWNRAIVR